MVLGFSEVEGGTDRSRETVGDGTQPTGTLPSGSWRSTGLQAGHRTSSLTCSDHHVNVSPDVEQG